MAARNFQNPTFEDIDHVEIVIRIFILFKIVKIFTSFNVGIVFRTSSRSLPEDCSEYPFRILKSVY